MNLAYHFFVLEILPKLLTRHEQIVIIKGKAAVSVVPISRSALVTGLECRLRYVAHNAEQLPTSLLRGIVELMDRRHGCSSLICGWGTLPMSHYTNYLNCVEVIVQRNVHYGTCWGTILISDRSQM